MEGSNLQDFQIPVIDLTADLENLGRDVVDAVEQCGFVFIRNQTEGISAEAIERAFDLSRTFFRSPREKKAECSIGHNNKGWTAMHSERLDPEHQRVGDFKECFNVREFVNGKASQPLPSSMTSREAEIGHFFKSCDDFCKKILRLFAIGLELDDDTDGEDWFSTRHDARKGPTGTTLRYLYYPSITPDLQYDPQRDVRAGAHSDYGSITLLFQRPNEPGLEILTPSKTWHPVPVYPSGTENDPTPPILVNIGDLFSYWTNGLLKSTVHRVVTTPPPLSSSSAPPAENSIDMMSADRFSIAFFCHPLDEIPLAPIPSRRMARKGLRSARESGPGRSGQDVPVVTAGDYLRQRLAATYDYSNQGLSDH